jgi:hypothetical protein
MRARSRKKQLVEEFNDGGVRFQGEIPHPDGSSLLDTLLPGSRFGR